MMEAMQPAITCAEFVKHKYYFEVTAVYDETCCCADNKTAIHPLNVVPIVNP
jgi:hypothetical protein